MPNSETPADGSEQPNIEASSRHDAVIAGARAAPTMEESSRQAPFDGGVRPPSPPEQPGGWSGQHPHAFHLSAWAPDVFAGGTLQGATGDNWKILSGQQASVYLARLEPGGVREPHWHPSAWELNFVISGVARWSFVGPEATHDAFEVAQGDLVFAPQGHFHYFENASETEELVVLIVFNSSASEPADDIGIVASLSAIPAEVLAAVFGASPELFAKIPRKIERVTIAKRPDSPSTCTSTSAMPSRESGERKEQE
ncbi:cupin domain-containing protein [Caballeronia sp. ATUFL_M2_KS44]|uniref:cupin domain-containing protein n=1 Tax=Caballeronia sp. ATUFL_M2_KS44 TaxID=2921767 RepID=UPI0020276E84|nr:cupin domain-containing protein [Caballeronia sp. ATUFL_M2_KS44]